MCIDSSLQSEVVIQRRIELICKGAISPKEYCIANLQNFSDLAMNQLPFFSIARLLQSDSTPTFREKHPYVQKCPESKERYDCGFGRDIYVTTNLYLNIFQFFTLT